MTRLPQQSMSALSIPTATRIYLTSNLNWFFGNLSSWLQVLPHADMKNGRFSSPFISFYEIVIILTSGSLPSVWITVIPSAFPWSSTLFLDLPDCGSALIFPITSRFPLRTMSKTQHAALQLKLCQCWRSTLDVLKGHMHKTAGEKRSSLWAGAHVAMCTGWRGVTQTCTNT